MQGIGTVVPYVNLRQMLVGRRLWTFKGLLEEACQDPQLHSLKPYLIEAIEHDRQTLALVLEWESVRGVRPRRRGNAQVIDAQIDAQISAIQSIVLAHTKGPDDDSMVQLAKGFMQEVFPRGVVAITKLPFEEQLARVEELQERFEGPLSGDVEALGVTKQVERLKPLISEFRKELKRVEAPALSWDDVKAAHLQGHEYLAGALIRVLGSYPGTDADSTARREAILAEMNRQQEYVREENSRSRTPVDVDPDTGVEVDPGEDAEVITPVD